MVGTTHPVDYNIGRLSPTKLESHVTGLFFPSHIFSERVLGFVSTNYVRGDKRPPIRHFFV